MDGLPEAGRIRRVKIIDTIQGSDTACAATIGFFDGVHRGHRYLLDQVRDAAQQRGLASQLITFPEHPRRTLCPDFCPQILTTTAEKLELLETTGIDRCALFPFTPELAQLSAYDFMKSLFERFGVRALVIGYDHRFGHDRRESFDDYVAYGKQMGIEVIQAGHFAPDGLHISSSAVRKALLQGDAERAACYLGRPYSLTGKIIEGHHIGSGLGFPTANLLPENEAKLVPANGAYAAEATVEGETYAAMLNIGTRPTLNNGPERSIEAHLLGFSGNLYGKNLTLRFRHYLRDERKFDSLETLTAQLRHDAAQTAKLLLP